MRKTYMLLLILLAACDRMPTESSPTSKDSTTTSPTVSVADWRVCATGRAPDLICPRCQQYQFEWGMEIRLSRGDTIEIPSDTTRCRDLGAFPDTLRFKVLGIGQTGFADHIWFESAGDSIPLKWEGRWNADSLRAVRWED